MPKAPKPRKRSALRLLLGSLVVLLVLIPASAEAATFGSRTLHVGSRGSDVKALQRHLTTAGFRAAADGVFGQGTRRQVGRWQRSAHRRVTGIVTRADARALLRAVHRSFSGGVSGALELPDADDEDEDATVPGARAKLAADGTAIAPASAPPEVKRVIAAGNRIAFKPYIYGGGHGRWFDRGYDCSGSVSFALHGGGLLRSSMPSGDFMSWGARGHGKWITLYANGGHIFMIVAGLRFDTSGATAAGSRWQTSRRSTRGYAVRHPIGF